MVDSSSSHKITPLGDDDYASWRFELESSLIAKDLVTFMSSADAAADDPDRDRTARAPVGLRVGKQHLRLIFDSGTARIAWGRLYDLFQAQSSARAIILQRDLLTVRIGPAETVSQYVCRTHDLRHA